MLSEKPIAKDVAAAQELLKWYRANIDTTKVLWAVGENYRYLTKFLFAAEQVRQLGPVRNFRINVHSLVKPDNKYYRKSNFEPKLRLGYNAPIFWPRLLTQTSDCLAQGS